MTGEIRGIGVSPGVAIGPAVVVLRESRPLVRLRLAPEAVEAETERFLRAVEASRGALARLRVLRHTQLHQCD